MAWPTVLQGVVGDVQLLLSLPLTPLTYHLVADAIGDRPISKLIRSRMLWLNVMARPRVENCRLCAKPDAEGRKTPIRTPRLKEDRTGANEASPKLSRDSLPSRLFLSS